MSDYLQERNINETGRKHINTQKFHELVLKMACHSFQSFIEIKTFST